MKCGEKCKLSREAQENAFRKHYKAHGWKWDGGKRMNWAWTETARGEKQSQKKKKRKKEDDFIIVATLKGKRPAEASHARRRR